MTKREKRNEVEIQTTTAKQERKKINDTYKTHVVVRVEWKCRKREGGGEKGGGEGGWGVGGGGWVGGGGY